MRRPPAIAVLALWTLVALAGSVGLSGPAGAGGPTSVLITQPGTGQATALYYDAGEYAELDELLTSAPGAAADAPSESSGKRYTLTWMIHDVTPWRIDSVHIAGDGTALLSTTFVNGSEGVGPEGTQSSWRAVPDGEKLAALLDRVFAGIPVAAGSQLAAEEAPAEEAPAVTPAAPAPDPETRWFSLTGWRWAVPGVLGGLVVGLLASRRRAPAEPRRVLVEHTPERALT
jgi:hypothetical protein